MSMITRPLKPLEHDPTLVRELVVGPDAPVAPYPIYLQGWVERGFGRGSKELGCPTANLPDSAIEPYASTLHTGVHYGYARVVHPPTVADATTTGSTRDSEEDDKVWPMVMSIGWNPFYNNTTRTAEVHILRDFPRDFYGKELRVIMLGFVRPEYNYAGLDALIKDINTDKLVSLRSVERPAYVAFKSDPFFTRESDHAKLGPALTDPDKPKDRGAPSSVL